MIKSFIVTNGNTVKLGADGSTPEMLPGLACLAKTSSAMQINPHTGVRPKQVTMLLYTFGIT